MILLPLSFTKANFISVFILNKLVMCRVEKIKIANNQFKEGELILDDRFISQGKILAFLYLDLEDQDNIMVKLNRNGCYEFVLKENHQATISLNSGKYQGSYVLPDHGHDFIKILSWKYVN